MPPPVEYAVAVELFLAGASLGPSSRRIYRISLSNWAWPLVGARPPDGAQRRGAAPPVLPLALLDDPATPARLGAALSDRAARTDARTVNRELSALRSAVGWWRDQQWIRQDPTAALRHQPGHPAVLPALTASQLASLFGTGASLREQAFWRVLYDTGAATEEILALNAGELDLPGCRTRAGIPRPAVAGMAAWTTQFDLAADPMRWQRHTSDLLSWLLAGRGFGPVFLTDRRAPASAAAADVCPVTGRARMSYRRAAEIFARCTRPLDPAGRGWTLLQLRQARTAAAGRGASQAMS